MIRIVAIAVLVAALAGCDIVGFLKRGMEQADQTANDVQVLAGSKPTVGFKMENGRLVSVTVIFPGPLETNDFTGLTRGVRQSVEARFQQKPTTLIVGFKAADG